MTREALAELAAAVQRNCDLADARHAADLSLCTYLLEMRELYRWERALPLTATPQRAQVGAWIAEREARLQALADDAGADYAPLPLDDGVEAFDAERANDALRAHGMVYGAGIERFGRPGFFLAELASEERRDGARVLVTDAEHARGLNPPPAASRGELVLVRRDVLRRWLWTKMETASRRVAGDAFVAALHAYGGLDDAAGALERMAQAETETLVLHELGERAAGRMLGPDWEAMLAGLDDRRSEIVVRAVRDLVADCAVTLPTLLARGASASIHFWFSTFDGVRRELAPELHAAYAPWRDGDPSALAIAAAEGERRFGALAQDMLARWREGAARGVRDYAGSLVMRSR